MIKTLIFCLILTTSAFASDYITGEGRFYAQDGDSIQFVKKQLLYNAFRDVLNKELKAEGLDGKSFWENFDQAFEESFEETKEEIKNKYKIVEGEKISPRVKEKYTKELRAKRAALKIKFASIRRAISSYAVKTITRSPKYPKSRYLSLQAKVDRNILNKMYFRFIKNGEGKKYSSLIISPKLILTNLTWEELGVEVKNDLTEVIYGHWKKWYEENLGDFFGEVKIIEGDFVAEITPPAPKEEEEESTDETLEAEFKEEEVTLGVPLVLTVNINLSKDEERLLLKKRKISIASDGILTNQGTRQIIGHFNIPKQTHIFSTEKAQELGSNMASWIYRMPLMEFGKLKKSLTSNMTPSKIAQLKVEGITTISDLFALNKILQEKGVANQVVSKTKTYNGPEARILIYYQGSFDQLEQIVKGIKNLNIKDNKNLALTLLGA